MGHCVTWSKVTSGLVIILALAKVVEVQQIRKIDIVHGGGKRSPENGDPCDPVADRLHSVDGDKTAFLLCDLEMKHYRLQRCDSVGGVLKVFVAKRQRCLSADQENQWLLMSTPNNASWKKVGAVCVVNRECTDGMYCTGGVCSCYLNYAEVNSVCVRVSSVCPGSTYYPEPVNGKPKSCSSLDNCPPGYVCRPESGGDQGFCCLATAAEVCGLLAPYVVNDRPIPCFDSSSSESCPAGYVCQIYPPAGQKYCCARGNVSSWKSQGMSNTTATVTKGPDSAYCPPPAAPHLHDGFPVVCNPINEFSCPNGFHCYKNEKFGLHFCCSGVRIPSNTTWSPTTTTLATLHLPVWVNSVSAGDGRVDANEKTKEKGPASPPSPPPPPQPASTLPSPPPGPSPNLPDICSPSHRPFVFEGKPVLCIANDSSSCPIGYTCTMHTPTVHFCCRISSAPESTAPFVDVPTIVPITTSGSRITTATVPVPTTLPLIETICGASSKPYLYSGNPVMCLANETNNCPLGYFCDLHPSSGSNFCCQRTAAKTPPISLGSSRTMDNADGCPDDMRALRDPSGSIKLCDFTSNKCPVESVCSYSGLYSRHQCCSKYLQSPTVIASGKSARQQAPVISEDCPSGLLAYRDPFTSEPLTCTANHMDICPGGYFCQWSQSVARFLCCGVSAGCPARSVAHVHSSTGKVHYCGSVTDPSCPPGYTCQRASNGSYICCTSVSVNSPSTAPRLHPTSRGGNAAPQTAPVDRLCPVGSPFTELGTSGPYLACSEKAPCPPGHQCTPSAAGNVCCLRSDKVCGLPAEPGSVWCINANTLASSSRRYYYDAGEESCKSFAYNGCQGNLNNFDSVDECEQFCAKGRCPRGLPVQVSGKAQRCDSTTTSRCPIDYTCTAPSFSSASSKMICCPTAALICNLGPRVGQQCQSTVGNTSTVTRFYYHASLRVCRPFAYFGCNGNANNFETPAECLSFCGNVDSDQAAVRDPRSSLEATWNPQSIPTSTTSTTLPPDTSCPVFGQVPHIACRPSSIYPCPDGFTCQKGMKNGKSTDAFICCGPPTGTFKSQICPNGTEVYLHPVAKQPAICNPADAGACPRGFGCTLSKFMKTFYCCANSSTAGTVLIEPPPRPVNQMLNTVEEAEPECPPNRKPFLYPGTAKVLACVQPTSMCPQNYTCVLSSNVNNYLCCSEKNETQSSLPANPFEQRRLIAPPFSTLFTGRTMWTNGMAPLGVGHWVPTADEAQRTRRRFENGPVIPPDIHMFALDVDPAQSSKSQLASVQSKRRDDLERPELVPSVVGCDSNEKKQLGQQCCSDEQCSYQCSDLAGQRVCLCPRWRLIDFTVDPPRCASICNGWRFGGFCLPENSEAKLNLMRLINRRRRLRMRIPATFTRMRNTGRATVRL